MFNNHSNELYYIYIMNFNNVNRTTYISFISKNVLVALDLTRVDVVGTAVGVVVVFVVVVVVIATNLPLQKSDLQQFA